MWRVRVNLTGGAAIGGGVSTFYYSETFGTPQLAADVTGAFWNSIEPVCHPAVVWATDAVVETVDEVSGAITAATGTTPSTGVGSGGVEPLPWQNQGLLQLRTGVYVSGKEIRGRLFIPGAMSTAASAAVPTTAYKTAIETAATTLNGVAAPVWGVWSKTRGQWAPISATAMWTKFAVLRSRRD
jgi:hypothetical protein